MATKTITFEIDEKLADKFELAVQLTGDDRAAVAESFVKQYLAKALHAAAEEYHDPAEQTRQPQPEPQAQTRTGFVQVGSVVNPQQPASGSTGAKDTPSKRWNRFNH